MTERNAVKLAGGIGPECLGQQQVCHSLLTSQKVQKSTRQVVSAAGVVVGVSVPRSSMAARMRIFARYR